jgi:hypothetical protein
MGGIGFSLFCFEVGDGYGKIILVDSEGGEDGRGTSKGTGLGEDGV